MIVSLENICKSYNGTVVLNHAALTIEDNDRIGLCGVNGCGKSTLLRIISGLEEPEKQPEPNTEKVFHRKNSAIGFLEQDSGLERDCTIIEEVRGVFKELLSVGERLRELEAIMSKNHSAELDKEYGEKSAYFEQNDGYLIDVNIRKVLNGMNFSEDSYDRVISTLSGGEKTRLALSKLLLQKPDLLILDEPTNHLDFNTVIWLEEYLKDYKGALLIVSHDRYFLDRLCTSVCEIERAVLRRFKGNYSAFVIQKKALVKRQLKEYEEQVAEIAKLQEYIVKNITRASTSNMAKSRQKKLELLQENLVEKPVLHNKTANLNFDYERIPPLDILTVNELDITVGLDNNSTGVTLVESISFALRRGEKLGIIGSNGTGKSSLLKIIQKLLPHLHGSIEWAKNVKISYFEQENARLNPKDTVINSVHKLYPLMKEGEIRSLLGAVRLSGENVFKRVENISGGERAKLCFAIMSLERGNVLILDEPTNHLDIDTKEVLEEALCSFDGTVIFVSHDRYLLNRLATRIIEITNNNVVNYSGGFEEYMSNRTPLSPAFTTEKTAATVIENSETKGNYRTKEQRANDAKRRLRVKELEENIADLEKQMAVLQEEMTLSDVCSDYLIMQEKCGLYEQLKQQVSDFTDEWIILADNC